MADAQAYVNGVSQRFFETGLSLPSGSALGEEQFDEVAGAIEECLEKRA